jgi:hypothetical protein
VLADLRAFLARGNTLREASERLGEPQSTLFDLAKRNRLPRRRRGLSPEKKALVQRLAAKGCGGRRIEQKAKVSRETAWRYQQLAQFRSLAKRADTPLPCKPWRCPAGGEKLNVTICIVHGCRRPPKTATGTSRKSKTRRKAG